MTLSERLSLTYPILQGGMAWIGRARLAAAVSNAGGLGLIAAGSMGPEQLRQEIKKTRQLTTHTFGVNLMLMNPLVDQLADVVCQEAVPVVTTGAGSPGKFLPAWKQAGLFVIPVVASVGQARRVEQQGADAVITEGTEAGGHIGELTTLALLPQVVDAVRIPVIAAGGIADGRGLAAVWMLGASGVQLGTRFLVCDECEVHEQYKEKILAARDIDTVVTGRRGGHPVRSLKNPLARRLIQLENQGTGFETLEELTVGSLQRAVEDGDLEQGSFMAGQAAGLVTKRQAVADMIQELFEEAARLAGDRLISQVPGLKGGG